MEQFKINPTKLNPYFKKEDVFIRVCIFDSFEEMFKYHKDKYGFLDFCEMDNAGLDIASINILRQQQKTKGFIAKFRPQSNDVKVGENGDLVEIRNRRIGVILLCKQELNASVIAKQVLHATLATLRHLNSFPNISKDCYDEEEEKIAYTLQRITEQILHDLNQNKIWS